MTDRGSGADPAAEGRRAQRRGELRALAAAMALPFRADRRRAGALFALFALAAVADVAIAYWLKLVVDAAVESDVAAAVGAALGLGLTAALGMLLGSAGVRMMLPLSEQTGHYLDRQLVHLASGVPGLSVHEQPEYQDHVEVLRDRRHLLAGTAAEAATAVALVVQATGAVLLLVSVDPVLAALPLFAAASVWAAARAQRVERAALRDTAEDMRRARHLFDLATSPAAGAELRTFGLGAELLRRQQTAWTRVNAVLDRAAVRQLGWSLAGWLCFALGYVAAVVVVAEGAVSGRASLGDVVLALTLLAELNYLALQGAGTATAVLQTIQVGERYVWLRDQAAEWRLPDEGAAPAPDRLTAGIELRGVSFRYPGADADALTGIDLKLRAGSVVGVVGDNGAGKSTLVKLLCRLYEPTAGAVLVDGVGLRELGVAAWRARLSAGFQDAARFELLARETVGVGDLAAMDDAAAVDGALRRAAAGDVVSGLSAGLETQLGQSFEGGTELSGGQWQKLALARALMRRRPLLLILDEPTAALDPLTEHALFARYADAARAAGARTGAITLLVSHRFPAVRFADAIVVLDGGRVREVGTHAELLARDDLYAELYELQARLYAGA